MKQSLQQMVKSSLLSIALLSCGLLTARAEGNALPKDVFLIDVSASMSGRGSVATASVFDRMQGELCEALSQAKQTEVVLIPFATRPQTSTSLILPEDSSKLQSFLQALRPQAGRTDIYSAWQEALQKLSLDKEATQKRLFLITDGLHNSKKYPVDSLQAIVNAWSSRGQEAFLVLLDQGYDRTELAESFRNNDHMQVIYSLSGLYDKVVQAPDTLQSIDSTLVATKEVATTNTESSFSLPWWLWLLLALLILAVLFYFFRGSGRGSAPDVIPNSNPRGHGLPEKDDEDERGEEDTQDEEDEEDMDKEPEKKNREKKKEEDQDILATRPGALGGYELLYSGDDPQLIKRQRQAMRPEFQYISSSQRASCTEKMIEKEGASGTTLEKNMFRAMPEKAFRLKNAMGGAEAHHIIAGSDPSAQKARKILESCGYNINDAINGIFLPQGGRKGSATTTRYIGTCHDTSHSAEYHQEVYRRLQHLEHIADIEKRRRELGKVLDGIKADLRAGRLALLPGKQWYILPNGEHVERSL